MWKDTLVLVLVERVVKVADGNVLQFAPMEKSETKTRREKAAKMRAAYPIGTARKVIVGQRWILTNGYLGTN